MQIYKFISSKSIIEQVYRDNGYSTDLPWLDMIEWIYEALMLIGHPAQYTTKICGSEGNSDFTVTDHRAKLPDNFYRLLWILIDGAPGVLAEGGSNYLIDNCTVSTSYAIAGGTTFTDGFGNVFDNTLGGRDVFATGSPEYVINDNYIILSNKEADVTIGYLSYPVDCDGFPEIPDHIKCKMAVTKYLTKKLDYIEWRKGNLTKEIYDHSDRECNWYMASMANQLKLPDLTEMQNLKDQMIRSMPSINEEKSLFQFLGTPEGRRF